MRHEKTVPRQLAETQTQPPRLSPLLPMLTACHDACFTDVRATNDACPTNQRPWLEEFTGRVEFRR
jgi:hypothetical protein